MQSGAHALQVTLQLLPAADLTWSPNGIPWTATAKLGKPRRYRDRRNLVAAPEALALEASNLTDNALTLSLLPVALYLVRVALRLQIVKLLSLLWKLLLALGPHVQPEGIKLPEGMELLPKMALIHVLPLNEAERVPCRRIPVASAWFRPN